MRNLFVPLCRNDSGAAFVEYAMMLAVATAVTTLGFVSVFDAVRTATGRASHGALANRPAGRAYANDAATAHALVPVAPRHAERPTSLAIWQHVVSAALCLAVLLLWKVIRARPARIAADEDQQHANHTLLPAAFRNRIYAKRQAIYHILASDEQIITESRLKVEHVMTRNLVVVSPKVPVQEVDRLMQERRVRHILVCSGQDLLGVISDRDLKGRSGKTAADLMTSNPVTVNASTPVARTVTTLISGGFSCLPVLEAGRPCGLLTTSDLMMTLQCALHALDRILIQVGPTAETGITNQCQSSGGLGDAA